METLSEEAIRWAMAHIGRYGDTDIFPRPFEHEALNADLITLLPYLQGINLSTYRPAAFIQMMMPKEVGGFRAATQLDPIDSVIMAAIAYESADSIEGFRGPLATSPSCAYRVDKNVDGQLFGRTAGWDAFHDKSHQLATSGSYQFVVTADISDFYNQISHHRLNHALAGSGIGPIRCDAIENLMSRLAGNHHSQGLPVGPSISILFAEAVLVDVDNRIKQHGFDHCRYVDDFRIFCRTHEDAIRVLHELSSYLFVSHRLGLQSHKTKISPIEEFIRHELTDPEELEAVASKKHLAELVEAARRERYKSLIEDDNTDALEDVDEEKIAEDNRGETIRVAIDSLCDLVLATNPLPIGLSRYMLRRASEYKTRNILNKVLTNKERFMPVIRDLCLYLIKVHERDNPRRIGNALLELAMRSDYRAIPLVQYWILDAVCRIPAFMEFRDAWSILETTDLQIRPRMAALLAKAYGQVEWVRSRKQNWHNGSPWEQRAILYAASILPPEEKRHWLNHAAEDTTPHLRAIALWSISQ